MQRSNTLIPLKIIPSAGCSNTAYVTQISFLKSMRIAIVLLRNDLRVKDNQCLYEASKRAGVTHIMPLYCFDPRQIDVEHLRHGTRNSVNRPQTYVGGFDKIGVYRCRFLAECLSDLGSSLRARKSELITAYGNPSVVIQGLTKQLQSTGISLDSVFCQSEIASEELEVENEVEQVLKAFNVPLIRCWNSTMYHPIDAEEVDLKTYSHFRTQVEGKVDVRDTVDSESLLLPFPDGLDLTGCAVIRSQNCDIHENIYNVKPDERGIWMPGGETHAVQRLQHYLESGLALTYKKTRNESIGTDCSSKLSAYLALGCISARYIYHEIEKYEAARGFSVGQYNLRKWEEGPYWLYFEVLWRDYFKFLGMKRSKAAFFRLAGIDAAKSYNRKWIVNKNSIRKWIDGQTGVPWVDAGMRELSKTGYLSNRLRQNVASFFTHSLGLDWRYGAAYFESVLVDYDPLSNYGNWQYVSGVGTDPREHRKFNMIKQAHDYDPNGEYIRTWCPELAGSGDLVFTPWMIKDSTLNYPPPMKIEPEWARHNGASASKNKPSGGKNKGPRTSDWKVRRN